MGGFFNRFDATKHSVRATDLEVDGTTIVVDEVNNRLGVGDAVPGTAVQVTDTAPYLTLKNSTAENTAGGCEAKVIFEDHANVALAQVEGSHSGTADDTKGKFVVSTHTGSALTAALTINDAQAATFAADVFLGNNLQIGDGKSIVDGSGNELLQFCEVSSAVNHLEIENAASGTAPAISAIGDSANITISVKPKGTGGFRVYGSTAAAATVYINEDSDNGTNFMGHRAAASIGTSHVYTWPGALPGSNLVLQSDNAGTLTWVAGGDITGVTAGTGLSGGGTSGAVTLNVDAAQTQITSVGTIGTGTWQGTAVASAYLDADTAHLSGAQTFSGTKTLNSFKGTGAITVTNILDEDAMGTNSDTALATQQSIKAYADTKSPVAGHSSIATVGTIGTGTWQGTAIANAYVADLPTSKIVSGTMADARIAESNVTQHQGAITETGAVNVGSITSGFTSIDVGAGAISTTGTMATGILNATGSAPYLTLKNSTAENGEGGAESRVLFVDHAAATLAQVEGSHAGTADDTKGKFIVSTHNGSSLTPALTINETQTSTFSGNVEIQTDLDNNFTALSLYNQSDSADTNGSVALAFDLEDTAGTKVDAGMIQVVKEASFTSTASTQDSRMVIALSENGTLGAKATLTSAGNLQLAGNVQVSGRSIADDSGGAAISFDGSANTQINGNSTIVGDLNISGGDALVGTAGNTTATTITTVTNTGTNVGKNLTIAAGSTTVGANNLNGGDLVLSSGSGDGNGTSSIVFKTKVNGTDAAAERLRIDLEGAVEANYATPDAFGAGLSSAASKICKIAKVNGVIETTILIDITGLDSHNTVGHVIGDSDGSAELTKVTFEKNGYIYRIEMACIETPASAGSVTTNIKLVADTSARDAGYSFASASSDDVVLVTGAWAAFQYEGTANSPAGSAVIAAGLDDRFLHLTTGAGSGGAGEYNAGKFMIKLYGVAF
jgi:hypothetical protein